MKRVELPCKEFGHFDLVVAGGGCAGVFAAVRAARLGLKTAIVEKHNCFGGVATAGLVNVWHSILDIDGKEQIIAGLTEEVRSTLLKNGNAVLEDKVSPAVFFDPNVMKWELDKLAVSAGVHIFFHTHYHALQMEDRRITGVILGNKDGLGILTGDFFIDATGDGDLCRDGGVPSYRSDNPQPPSACYFLNGKIQGDLEKLVTEHGAQFGLEDDWGWDGILPGLPGLSFRADFHVFGKQMDRALDLTQAEIEGRQKIYALAALLKKYDNPDIGIAALCSQIGIRETVHYETRFRANERDLLLGTGYEDTVMRGSYRVDIHHHQDNGITFKYLDGRKEVCYGKGNRTVCSNWREEEGITGPYARYYQIPFEILIQEHVDNLIPVGRMIHADQGSFGALRVMVNLNQLGEAAGVAAWLALQEDKTIQTVDGKSVQRILRQGGSI